ncbi:hypothetical protein K503DRAFT_769943 [Rhizopogon vinicolor AM-OR11-026]|uniref:C2H2-type domain-containing protein n=1 Tax=Rhizopogon vinicolor AM-OR11-026 TaxID=1314800 RepID=A0A1B7N288_9AGAM|nr:hypothetical protein K503DRAFT_769943 [Rhizopogon vinicolor AM-OR11-026]
MSEVAGPSDLLLSPHEIPNIAHHIIKPMPCEWEGCSIILNSCYNLTQHTLRHCDRISSIEGQYHCRYLRCAGRVHATKDALKAHVDLSHLSRLDISCPIRDCEQGFSRASQLESHFEVNHKDLVARHVTRTFEQLVPTAPPVRRVITPPPPLPSQRELHCWHFAAPTISLPPRHKSRSPLVPVEPTSRKWSRLEVPDADDDNDNPVIPLDDLIHPMFPLRARKEIDLRVQRKSPGSLSENFQRLSCPQSMPHPLPRDDRVPRTIGFSIFTQKFEKLVEDGVVNGSGHA